MKKPNTLVEILATKPHGRRPGTPKTGGRKPTGLMGGAPTSVTHTPAQRAAAETYAAHLSAERGRKVSLAEAYRVAMAAAIAATAG